MPVISVSKTVPANVATKLVAALCLKHKYQANIPNPNVNVEFLDAPTNEVPNPTYQQATIPNPETNQQFAQRILDTRFVEYGVNVMNWYDEEVAKQAITPVTNADFT